MRIQVGSGEGHAHPPKSKKNNDVQNIKRMSNLYIFPLHNVNPM